MCGSCAAPCAEIIWSIGDCCEEIVSKFCTALEKDLPPFTSKMSRDESRLLLENARKMNIEVHTSIGEKLFRDLFEFRNDEDRIVQQAMIGILAGQLRITAEEVEILLSVPARNQKLGELFALAAKR